MDILIQDIEGSSSSPTSNTALQEQQQQQQPLLENAPKLAKTPTQKAMRKTFKGTAHLARLLPTGSVLTFQMFSPVLTHQGKCPNDMSRLRTAVLLAFCGISCFFVCFTDSFRDERGKVRYGLATFKGLWVIDKSIKISEEEAAKYKIKFIDFFHAFSSILVFGAVALFDTNVVNCFCPEPTDETKEMLVSLPVGIGIVCSILFVMFPSKRHGIGSPLSRR